MCTQNLLKKLCPNLFLTSALYKLLVTHFLIIPGPRVFIMYTIPLSTLNNNYRLCHQASWLSWHQSCTLSAPLRLKRLRSKVRHKDWDMLGYPISGHSLSTPLCSHESLPHGIFHLSVCLSHVPSSKQCYKWVGLYNVHTHTHKTV